MVMKARFLDEDQLRQLSVAADDGIFPRDCDLKDFLRQSPSVLATLRKLHGFLNSHSEEDCRDIIEAYVLSGGDGGVTRRSLRYACGLEEEVAQPKEVPVVPEVLGEGARRFDPAPPTGTGAASSTDCNTGGIFDPVRSEQLKLHTTSFALMRWMLANKRDYVSMQLLLKSDAPGWKEVKDKKKLFAAIVSLGGWMRIGKRNKMDECYVPRLSTTSLSSIFPPLRIPPSPALPELHDAERLSIFLDGNPARSSNVDVLVGYLEKVISVRFGTRKGRRSEEAARECELLALEKAKIEKHENAAQHFLQTIRRGGSTILCSYATKVDRRSRRYVRGHGAQSISRKMRLACIPGVEDWDIESAQLTIASQVADRLEGNLLGGFPSIRRYVTDKDGVSRGLGVASRAAKKLVLETLNGQGVPEEHKADEFLTGLYNEGRVLRWLGCSLQPALLSIVEDDSTKKWPEATMFHFLWTAVEDYILESWTEFILQHEVQHLSLHFDGVLVDSSRVRKSPDFKAESEEHILKETGYKVNLVRKVPLVFLEGCRANALDVRGMDVPAQLLTAGNCIPCAMGQVLGNLAAYEAWVLPRTPINMQAELARSRPYVALQGYQGRYLVALADRAPPRSSGRYLFHVEADGNPHCVGVVVEEGCDEATLFDGNTVLRMTTDALLTTYFDAVDRSSFVVFAIVAEGPQAYNAPETHLLLLRAGAAPTFYAESDVIIPGDILLARLEREVEDYLYQVTDAISE